MKRATYSEAEAIKVVDDALARLDEDARKRVIEWAASKYSQGLVQKTLPGGKPGPDRSSTSVGSTVTNIKQFMAQKKPGSFYERVACLAYYLEKVEGKTELKTADITKANTDARL